MQIRCNKVSQLWWNGGSKWFDLNSDECTFQGFNLEEIMPSIKSWLVNSSEASKPYGSIWVHPPKWTSWSWFELHIPGPHLSCKTDRELFPPLRVWRGCVEWGVVTGLRLPLAVEIVGHQVDEIQRLSHIRYVIASSARHTSSHWSVILFVWNRNCLVPLGWCTSFQMHKWPHPSVKMAHK